MSVRDATNVRVSAAAGVLLHAALLLAGSPPADATIAFRAPSMYFSTGSRPTFVAIADLDRDGKADLVTTNVGDYFPRSSSISILKGRGDGTFEPHRMIPVGYAPQAVVVEDLDGDDVVDLVVSHHGEGPVSVGTVAVFLGYGDGTFGPATNFAGGDRVNTLNAVDLDGDGKLDLVTENAALLGNGDGTFGAPKPFGSSGDYHAAVGDLDQDGHADVVTSNFWAEPSDEDVPWYRAYAVRLGNGDGTFQQPVWNGEGFRCLDVELADLDGDGLLDVVLCNQGDDRGYMSGVQVLPGKGDGTFGAARLLPTAMNPSSVTVADINGDGRLDLVTANTAVDFDFDENSLTILLGNGDGTFVRLPELQAGRGPVFAAAGRLDADGTMDLVAVNIYQAAVSVFIGNGDGTFGNPDQPVGRRPRHLATADFDQDGHADLVSTTGDPYIGTGGISVFPGRGDATFGDPRDSHSGSRWFVKVVNLDGHPAPDLVVTSATGFSAMLANGDGTFRGLAEVFLDPRFPGRPAIADFDRDGHMDVAVPQDYGADAVSILLGQGDGTFGPVTRFVTGRNPSSAAAGDLNADGMPDLVLGLAGFSVSVLLGNGDGTFTPHVTYASGNFFSNAALVGLADFDEDGRLDVVNGNLLWLGNGDGTLRAPRAFDSWHGERGLVIEDFDGDHHLDLASLFGEEARLVGIQPGRGDGTFGPRLDYGTSAWPVSLSAADFDGDGRIDLAVSNSGSASISVLLNRSQAPVIPVGFGLRPAVVHARSDARWISGLLETPAPHSAADIDIGSIRLNGVVPVDGSAPGASSPSGSRELVVRFDRRALAAILPAGDAVPVTVTGRIGRDTFAGTTAVRVLGRGVLGPSGRGARHALRLHILATARADGMALRLGVTLTDEVPARLDVIDVAGRVVATRSLESLAAGPHEIELAGTNVLTPGIYFVRLRQGSQVAHARAAILR